MLGGACVLSRARVLGARPADVVAVAALQLVLPFVLLAYGQDRLTTSAAGLLIALVPVWTLGFAAVARDARGHDRREVQGVVLGAVGVTVYFAPGLVTGAQSAVGVAAVTAAAAGFALGGLVARRAAPAHPLSFTTAVMAVGTALLAPLVLVPGGATWGGGGADAWVAVLLLGTMGTGVVFLGLYRLIVGAGALYASLVDYLAPVCAVFYGVALLGESVSASGALGLSLVVAGTWTVGSRRPRGRAGPR